MFEEEFTSSYIALCPQERHDELATHRSSPAGGSLPAEMLTIAYIYWTCGADKAFNVDQIAAIGTEDIGDNFKQCVYPIPAGASVPAEGSHYISLDLDKTKAI